MAGTSQVVGQVATSAFRGFDTFWRSQELFRRHDEQREQWVSATRLKYHEISWSQGHASYDTLCLNHFLGWKTSDVNSVCFAFVLHLSCQEVHLAIWCCATHFLRSPRQWSLSWGKQRWKRQATVDSHLAAGRHFFRPLDPDDPILQMGNRKFWRPYFLIKELFKNY